MASLMKIKQNGVVPIINHNRRVTKNPSNKDIDSSKTHENYSLLKRDISDYEFYKKRKSELYVYNKKDLNVLAQWCITAPKDLPPQKHREFFIASAKFLLGKYGGSRNAVQILIHKDEAGEPHLHYVFFPVVPDTKANHSQSEKICFNEVITRQELISFHKIFQSYINEAGFNTKVHTGITREQGGNRTVEQLKKQDRKRKWDRSQERTNDISNNRDKGRW